MPIEIVRQQTPEEAELIRKREELAAVRAELAEHELELADLRAQLKSFEGKYLRQVGTLYAELDEWDARIAELEASQDTRATSQQRAAEARQRADETRQATHGEASKADDFQPSPDLKRLFRDIAKRIHPDFSKDDADRRRRHDLMAQANEAYNRRDVQDLDRILIEYQESSEFVQGEGVGAELIRLIRQLHQARKSIEVIDTEILKLRTSDIARLKIDTDAARQEGRDLLAELAVTVSAQIDMKKTKHSSLAHETENYGR